jgi:hypothetical protein
MKSLRAAFVRPPSRVVDRPDWGAPADVSMAHLSAAPVQETRLAVNAVGAGHHLANGADRLAMGHDDLQAVPVVDGPAGDLAVTLGAPA